MNAAKEFAMKQNPLLAEKVEEEMINFVSKMSSLSVQQQEILFKMSSKQYWNVFGRHEFPAIYEVVAKPIIEMVASAGASERIWSTFNFVHSRLRNRLTNERVNKLVFLYTNTLLLDQMDRNDYINEEGALLNGNDC